MKALYLKIRANEPLYRALRTFIQTFIGTALSALAVTGFDNLTKKAVITVLGSALSAAVAAVMNMNKDNPEEAEEAEVD